MPRLVSARVDVHSVFFGFEYSELLIYILFKAVNFTWKVNLSMIKSGIYMNWCMDISLRSINHFCSHGQTNLRVCFIFCWGFFWTIFFWVNAQAAHLSLLVSETAAQTSCTRRLIIVIRQLTVLISTEPVLPLSEMLKTEHRASNCVLR